MLGANENVPENYITSSKNFCLPCNEIVVDVTNNLGHFLSDKNNSF